MYHRVGINPASSVRGPKCSAHEGKTPAFDDRQVQMELYLQAAGLEGRSDKSPLFRTAKKRKRELTERGLNGNDLLRILKRRLVNAGLPPGAFCCHSFRATTATNLLKQKVS